MGDLRPLICQSQPYKDGVCFPNFFFTSNLDSASQIKDGILRFAFHLRLAWHHCHVSLVLISGGTTTLDWSCVADGDVLPRRRSSEQVYWAVSYAVTVYSLLRMTFVLLDCGLCLARQMLAATMDRQSSYDCTLRETRHARSNRLRLKRSNNLHEI